MDWIGDKLSMLIEQGKRALGTEVVVMSDAKEDEVDDGSPGWEEEEEDTQATISRSGSKRPRSILPPSSFTFTSIPIISHAASSSSSCSPTKRSRYDSTTKSFTPSCSAPGSTNYTTPRKTHSRGISHESGLDPALLRNGVTSASTSFLEDSSSWESPEIREGMEKARSRYFERR